MYVLFFQTLLVADKVFSVSSDSVWTDSSLLDLLKNMKARVCFKPDTENDKLKYFKA